MSKIIVAILLITVELLNAQTNSEVNKIEKELNQCLTDSSGVTGQFNCLNKAAENWEKLMQKKYNLLLKILPEEERQDLINAQKKWEEYEIVEALLAEKIESRYYSLNPKMTIYPQIAEERKMNLLKTRAIELTEYCNLITDKK